MKKFWIIAIFLLMGSGVFVYQFFPQLVEYFHERIAFLFCNMKVKKIVVNGCQYEYAEGGKGDKIIICLHGFESDKRTWISYCKRLAKKYHLVALDLPGHGGSSCPIEQQFDVSSVAKTFHDFIEAKEFPSFSLMGTSMGGGVATMYCYHYPEKVEKLILINPLGVRLLEKSDLLKKVAKGKNLLFPDTTEDLEKFGRYLTGKQFNLFSRFKSYVLQKLLRKRSFFEKAYQELLRTEPLDDYLPSINTPTLVIMGGKDRILPPSSYEVFVKKMPNASRCYIKKGHHVLLDNNFEIGIEAINCFLEKQAFQDGDRQKLMIKS